MSQYLRESYNTSKNYLTTPNPNGIAVLKRESAEQSKEYESRIDRCPVRNHIGLIIDRYRSSAIKSPAERDESWKDLFSDYLPSFTEALRESQIVGRSFIVASLSDAQRRSEVDLKVYVVPGDVVLEYIPGELFAYNLADDSGKFKVIYDNVGNWTKVNDSSEVVESGLSGFDELPVVVMNPKFPGESQVGMLAPIQESLVNLLSLHMEESLQSTFTRHIISNLSNIPKTFEEEQKVQRMISGKKLLLFKDQISVNSLSADASQAQNLLQAIKQTEDMLYAVAGLRLSEPVRESGIAKKLEMEQFTDIRNKLVEAFETAENNFMELLSRAFGTTWEKTYISRDVVFQSWNERIAEIRDIISLGVSEEFKARLLAKLEADYELDQ